MKNFSLISGIVFILLLTAACEELSVDSDAVAVTKGVSVVTSLRAEVSCLANVVEEGVPVSRGVMFSTDKAKIEAHEAPVISDFIYNYKAKESAYEISLKGLLSNKVYYYCAVVRVGQEKYYGKIKSFKTRKAEKTEHASVDLGLPSGTLWATCNIGAEVPEDYGYYFAWGETKPQEDIAYSWDSYKYCKGSSNTLTKYCNDKRLSYNGFADAMTELELSDDAAYVNWGDGWRIPSAEQWKELRDNCKWVDMSLNGSNGYKVIGPTGRSIFIPEAGIRYQGYLNEYPSELGYYWTRSFYKEWIDRTDSSWDACSVYFSYFFYFTLEERCFGLSIRPVREAE